MMYDATMSQKSILTCHLGGSDDGLRLRGSRRQDLNFFSPFVGTFSFVSDMLKAKIHYDKRQLRLRSAIMEKAWSRSFSVDTERKDITA
jgi:hypothetical protein